MKGRKGFFMTLEAFKIFFSREFQSNVIRNLMQNSYSETTKICMVKNNGKLIEIASATWLRVVGQDNKKLLWSYVTTKPAQLLLNVEKQTIKWSATLFVLDYPTHATQKTLQSTIKMPRSVRKVEIYISIMLPRMEKRSFHKPQRS